MFRPENPPPPPPTRNVIGYEFGNETFWPHHLSTLPHGQATTKIFHVLSLDSSVTVLRSNRVVGVVRIALALAFVNKCPRKASIITIIHHLSSPPVIIFEESHHFVTPGVKVNWFFSLPCFRQVLRWFCLDFPVFWFHNKNLCLKAGRGRSL